MLLGHPTKMSNVKEFHSEASLLKLSSHNKDSNIFFKKIERNNNVFNSNIVFEDVSDTIKFLFLYYHNFFHIISDLLPSVLYEYRLNPHAIFIFHVPNEMERIYTDKHSSFFFDFLEKKGIKYITLCPNDDQVINLSNFYTYRENLPLIYDNLVELENEMNCFWSDSNPKKKVYLSRKKIQIKKTTEKLFGQEESNNFLFNDDNRVDKEEILETFFKSLGFEIIYPEDFKSFEEQINYFSDVRLIAGVTGAGLINSLFMPKGGIVCELTTPLLLGGIESTHHYYKDISFVKNHKYLSIVNLRNASIIVDDIKNNEAILNLLSM